MAQKQKQKKNKKWALRFLMILLFVAAAVCYLVWDAYFKTEKSTDEGVLEEVEVVEKLVENSDVTGVDSEVMEKEKVVQYEGEDPNVSEELTGVVTYAGVSGDNLMIRVNIDQYLESGKCVLSLVRDGSEVYTDEAGIATAASTATCEGFNVPVSVLGAGDYYIVIRLSAGDKVGTIRGEVSV